MIEESKLGVALIAKENPEKAESSRPRCDECGSEFDAEFSRDGVYCFGCSVHVANCCSDESK